jgi:hypothetical protein
VLNIARALPISALTARYSRALKIRIIAMQVTQLLSYKPSTAPYKLSCITSPSTLLSAATFNCTVRK